MNSILVIAVGVTVPGLFVGVSWWFTVQAREILQDWAAENGFQIIRCKPRYLFRTGPFKWWTVNRNQIVYWVKVRDQDGHARSGWVLCGTGSLGGVWFSRQAEVRWDEP